MPVAAPMHPAEEREAIVSCRTPRWIHAGLDVILRRSMRHQAGTRPEILYVPITFEQRLVCYTPCLTRAHSSVG